MTKILFYLLTFSVLSYGINSCTNNSEKKLEEPENIFEPEKELEGRDLMFDSDTLYEEPEEEFNVWCEWCNQGVRGYGVTATIERNYKIRNVKCCSHKCKAEIEKKYPYIKEQMTTF